MTDRIDLVRFQRAITTTANGTVVTGITAGTAGSTTQFVLDSAGNVGIGTASPTFNAVTGTVCHVHSSNTAGWSLSHYTNGTTGAGPSDGLIVGFVNDGSNAYIYNYEAASILFGTSGTERMRIDASGRVTTPFVPAFSVNSRQINGYFNNITIVYKNVIHNNGGHYSTTTGRFTAPVAGRYFFSAGAIALASGGGNGQLAILKNGSTIHANYIDFGSIFTPVTTTAVVELAVNDFVDVRAFGSVAGWFDNGGSVVEYNNFSGFLIG